MGLREPIAELVFSPGGRSLVAIVGNDAVRITDVAGTGGPMAAERLPTARSARRIAFVPRGEGLLATAADDGRVTIGDAATPQTADAVLVHPPGRSVVAIVR